MGAGLEVRVTSHGAPQTVTRLELTDEKPSPLMTSSAPPATPTVAGARPLTWLGLELGLG